jgi:hypothetical protein
MGFADGRSIMSDKETPWTQFLERMEIRYEQVYRQEVRREILRYVLGIEAAYLPALYDETVKLVSWRYKALPDICDMDQAMKTVLEKHVRIDASRRLYIEAPKEGCLPREEVAKVLAEIMNRMQSKTIRGKDAIL